MITGIGFFYGNYLSINTFVSATGPCEGATKCKIFFHLDVNSDFTSCVSTCTGANTLYLQKVNTILFRCVFLKLTTLLLLKN